MTTRLARGLAVAAFLLASPSRAHFTSTLDDIQHLIFDGRCTTSGCHASNAGELSLREGESWGQLVFKRPANAAAGENLKLRVDPGRPWNSYLVDKLRGRFRIGEEGARGRMPADGALTECEIRNIERWILGGAPETGFVDGDRPGVDDCEPTQPPLAAPAPPPGAVQVHAAGPESTVTVPAGFVTRIEVYARAGTDYLTITRPGDAAPLMVARGNPDGDATQIDSLVLPAGVGVAIGGDVVVRQTFAGERFDPDGVAESAITFHLASEVSRQLVPFLDRFAGDALLVPPRALGAAGGVWSPEGGASVVALRVWTDPRAVRAVAIGPGGIAYQAVSGTPDGYAVSPIEVPAGTGLAYACEQDNTHLVRQLRWGCGPAPLAGHAIGVPPPGMPAIAGGGPAPPCDEQADCEGSGVCVPANLVGGDGVEDGRCSLVGLRIAE